MTSPPLVRPAMLLSLLALSAALPFGNLDSLGSLLGPIIEAKTRFFLGLFRSVGERHLPALQTQRDDHQPPPTATPCETQPSPLPAAKAPHQKPAVTTCAKSCKQLLNQGGSPQDGVYWFTGMPVPTLCDFHYDGGGWTLLLTAAARDGWDPLSVQGRSERSPSLSDNYSILQHADAIRDLASGGRFNYRIETQAEKGRQRWGGIWQAPRGYSFVAESPSQTDVRIVRKFDTWSYSDDGIEQRMPWLNAGSGDGLLTTSKLLGQDWWGTLVTRETQTGWQHSQWIEGEAENSGKVLYWVRE